MGFGEAKIFELKIKIHVLPGGTPPRRMTSGAAGFDLFARTDEEIRISPGEIVAVPVGFKIEVPPGYEAQIRPRSGLAVRGIILPNSPGTVDPDYRGEVRVILANIGKEPFVVRDGDRIAQMVICPVPPVELVEVDELSPTDRGEGGFGSTGI